MNIERNNCDMWIPTPQKFLAFDSQSTSSCSSSQSQNEMIIPQRGTNPILNDARFAEFISTPFESPFSTGFCGISSGSISSSNSLTSFDQMTHSLHCHHLLTFSDSSSEDEDDEFEEFTDTSDDFLYVNNITPYQSKPSTFSFSPIKHNPFN